MLHKIETVVDIKRDGLMEIPVDELVAGDRVRVTLVVEEMLEDGEMEDLVRAYDAAKAEREASGSQTIPFSQVLSEIAEEDAEAQFPVRKAA